MTRLLTREGRRLTKHPGHFHEVEDFKTLVAGNNVEIEDVSLADREYILISMSPSAGIASNPPDGQYKVKNLYVNSQNGKLVVEYETT